MDQISRLVLTASSLHAAAFNMHLNGMDRYRSLLDSISPSLANAINAVEDVHLQAAIRMQANKEKTERRIRFQWSIPLDGWYTSEHGSIVSPAFNMDGERWRLVATRDDDTVERRLRILLDLTTNRFSTFPPLVGLLFFRVLHPSDRRLSTLWFDSRTTFGPGLITRGGQSDILPDRRVEEFKDGSGHITIQAFVCMERGAAIVKSKLAESARIVAAMDRRELAQAKRELEEMKKQVSLLREEGEDARQQNETFQFALAQSVSELAEMTANRDAIAKEMAILEEKQSDARKQNQKSQLDLARSLSALAKMTADRDATMKELIATEAALKSSKRMRDTNGNGEEQPADKKQNTGESAPNRPPMLIQLNHQDQAYLRVSHHFHASRGGMPAYAHLAFDITQIHRVENAKLRSQFHQTTIDMYEKGQHSKSEPVRTVYHGTRPRNIDSIVRENLSMEKKGQTDSGWFGAGMYFSRYADYCMQYYTTGQWKRVEAGDRGRLLQFDIMPGRQYQVDHARMMIARRDGFDSHVSPTGFEYVMFDARHIRPRYVIDFEVRQAPGAAFTGAPEQTG